MNEVTPIYDPASGWAFNTATELGGVRGKRIDQAIADISALNRTLGASIPTFVMGCFWKRPDPYRQWVDYDAERFAPPTAEQFQQMSLNGDHLDQILQSLQAQANYNYAVAMGTGHAGVDVGGYRGELDVPGFPTYVPTPTVVFGPDGRPVTVTIPPERAAIERHAFWSPRRMQVDSEFAGHQFWGATGPVQTDHWLCDVWFDLRTDINCARYIRSWARAYGVSVAAEPTL